MFNTVCVFNYIALHIRQVHIPSESMKILWEQAIKSACVTFVEGYDYDYNSSLSILYL